MSESHSNESSAVACSVDSFHMAVSGHKPRRYTPTLQCFAGLDGLEYPLAVRVRIIDIADCGYHRDGTSATAIHNDGSIEQTLVVLPVGVHAQQLGIMGGVEARLRGKTKHMQPDEANAMHWEPSV